MRDPDFQRGDVKLWCGDCLEILPEIQAGSVDAVVTDPPYGHNNNNGDLISRREEALGIGESGEPRPILNDSEEANELYRRALPELYRVLVAGGCCCCCCGGGGGPDPQFARWSMWMDEVFQFKQMVVWDKGPMGMGWHYRRSYETVLVGTKRGAACKWHDSSGRIENIIRPGQYGMGKILPGKTEHPCRKPLELASHFIRLHSTIGDTVLDPFMGSGWCGEAAVKLGRGFVGIELDPVHFADAVRRITEAQDSLALFNPVEPAAVQGDLFPEVTS